ncbi:hypothetical protein T552_00389 [Pneumocystis carinii B80]|uniref:RING-type domain-containing protein n=1 Tax=Pneumocystis carinii (strain B80) TaxID=1408658 RepID=A0A0W4ZQN7_PNEC8|nr:hypothetical protein T552_00389 [Pneumocystis carinii B80]KTW30676.1 hypothetical protein T552_00389 [Pneumocystis carinii B80]
MSLPGYSYHPSLCMDVKKESSGDFLRAYKVLEGPDDIDKENYVFKELYKHDALSSRFSGSDNIGISRSVLQPRSNHVVQSANIPKSMNISVKSVPETVGCKVLDRCDEVLSPDSCFYSQPIIKPPKTANTSQFFRSSTSVKPASWILEENSPSKDLSEHVDALNIKNEAAIKSFETFSYAPESSSSLKIEKTIFANNSFIPDTTIPYKKSCNECNTDNAEFVLAPCGHKICQRCLSSLISDVPINLYICFICHKEIANFTRKSFLEPTLSSNKLQPVSEFGFPKTNSLLNSFETKQSRHSIFSESSESLNSTANCFLKDSLMLENPFSDMSTLVTPQDWTCLKISNIPWDLSIEAIHEFLGKNARIAPYNVHSQPIHFIMDRMSAKTQSECYVELSSRNDAQRLAERRSGKLLGSRNVVLEIATQEELMNRIFPKWKGEWKGVNPYVDENLKSIRQFSVPKAEIVTREELNSLISHVKTYRSPYSRKCPQRPFEDFISILAKFPWHKGDFYTISQRDLLHSSLISLIEILKGHFKKGRLIELNFRLLERLVHAGTTNTCFTEKQKFEIFKTAGLSCNFHVNRISLMNLGLKAVSCFKVDHLQTTEILSFLLYNGFKVDDLQLSEKDSCSLSDIAKIEMSYINSKLLEYRSSVLSTTLHSAFVPSRI